MNNLSFDNLTDLIFYVISLLTTSCYRSRICDLAIVKQDNLSKYTAYKMDNWHVQYWLKLTFTMVMGCVNAPHSCKYLFVRENIYIHVHIYICNSISNKAACWTKLDGTIWYRGKLHHEWMEWLVMIINSVTWYILHYLMFMKEWMTIMNLNGGWKWQHFVWIGEHLIRWFKIFNNNKIRVSLNLLSSDLTINLQMYVSNSQLCVHSRRGAWGWWSLI